MIRSLVLLRGHPAGRKPTLQAPQQQFSVDGLRASKEGQKRKTLHAKECRRVLINSTSSLAVFYVEQVALNRHVSPQQAAPLLMAGKRAAVKRIARSISGSVSGLFVGPGI